jgi:hypothetical protein
VPPQLQRFTALEALDLRKQREAYDGDEHEQHSADHLLLHSHVADLPAWLLYLPVLRELQVGALPAMLW